MSQDEIINKPGVGAIAANILEDQARPGAPTTVLKPAVVPAAVPVAAVPQVEVVEAPEPEPEPEVDNDPPTGEPDDNLSEDDGGPDGEDE